MLVTQSQVRLYYRNATADAIGSENGITSVIFNLINKHFDLRPGAIIDYFKLRRPIYRQIAAYGHFGRPDLDLPWEKTDKATILKKEGFGK